MSYDYLIVGAGFSGIVLAERLTTQLGRKCLLIDKRTNIGGNAFDYYDRAGVLVHKYGPHYFRTNSNKIIKYLSKFTKWHQVEYKIKSYTDGRYWSFPINLNTFEEFIGMKSTSEEMQKWLADNRIPIKTPKNSEEVIISQVGWELYKKFFEGYTLKQWKIPPKELDTSVCGRIPIRINRDDRYLRQNFQAMPKYGYTEMFNNMIETCGDKLEVELETSYVDVNVGYKHLIYTGPIDKYFSNIYGELPYRSLRFEFESFSKNKLKKRLHISGKVGFWQPAMQVNYPNSEDFTRIVEIKHATGQQTPDSTIVREYPHDFDQDTEPYYPIPTNESNALYKKYQKLASKEKNVSFVGRLATYKYYDMDQVVGMAMTEFERIKEKLHR